MRDAVRDVDGLALVEHDDAAGAHLEQRAVVRREEHGRPGLVDLLEEAEDVDRELRVEVAGGLVGEDERRLADDGARDGDALLLAAGEDARRILAAPREPDALERLADARADEALRQPEHLERDGDVLVDAPRRDELEVLEDDAEVAPQERDGVVAQARDVAAEEEDAAVVDRLGAVEQAQQRRLARAARARDEDELAALDDEVHPAQDGRALPVRLVDVLEDEDGPLRGLAGEARSRAQHRAEALGSSMRGMSPGIRGVRKATSFRLG